MKEIRYLMNGNIPERKAGFITLPSKPQTERFCWRETVVSLCLMPPAWAGTHRLTDYVQRMGEEAQTLWIAPELEPCFPGWKQPFLEPELAAFLLGEQPFRETVIILAGKEETQAGTEKGRKGFGMTERADGQPDAWWLERFLEDIFQDLNGLYLVGEEAGQELEPVLEWIYEQSGLAVCVTQNMPDIGGKSAAVVDLRRKGRVPVRKIAPGSLYLDLTSESGKQRFLKEKRTDISYISARNYLDTVCKARYNVI